MSTSQSLMTALFPDRESGELGFWALSKRGYTGADVNVLMSDYARKRDFAPGANDSALFARTTQAANEGSAALVGWNLPEERVRQYDEGMRRGGILMLVKPRNDQDARYFDNVWRINRAQNVYC